MKGNVAASPYLRAFLFPASRLQHHRYDAAPCCSPSAIESSVTRRAQSTLHSNSHAKTTPSEEDSSAAELKRKRTTEWKRKQDGQRFVDDLSLLVTAGRGGDGAISFHREKFRQFGQASGGNGAPGGNVLIVPSDRVSSLAHIPRVSSAGNGTAGRGSWRHGKKGDDLIIEVPFGTVVEGQYVSGPQEERSPDREERWQRRWVHTSGFEEKNMTRDAWIQANQRLDDEEYEARRAWTFKSKGTLRHDFSEPMPASATIQSADPTQPLIHQSGVPITVPGGRGGMGNPAFLTLTYRSPKFATRGLPGASMKIRLQLKLIADIGLVGFPNAGKSSLVRALTGLGTEVGSWAFTTLNPSVGVVRCWEGGGFGGISGGRVDETIVERRDRERHRTLGQDDSPLIKATSPELKEEFRFTIADNPGLVADASKNVGLGHAFLKSIERSKALVYVVDLSIASQRSAMEIPPEQALLTLREELEAYKPGLSKAARLIVANKADLLVPSASSDPAAEMEAKDRLAKLERFAHEEFGVELLPVSAKWGMNLNVVVKRMRGFVEESQKRNETTIDVDSVKRGAITSGHVV